MKHDLEAGCVINDVNIKSTSENILFYSSIGYNRNPVDRVAKMNKMVKTFKDVQNMVSVEQPSRFDLPLSNGDMKQPLANVIVGDFEVNTTNTANVAEALIDHEKCPKGLRHEFAVKNMLLPRRQRLSFVLATCALVFLLGFLMGIPLTAIHDHFFTERCLAKDLA